MTDSDERERYVQFLARRRAYLLDRIESAAARAGRDPREVELLAVSKTVGTDEVVLAREAGYTLFGENRPQELKRKHAELSGRPEFADVRFDMIGNLQKNKINQVIGIAHTIHSVSSVHLAEAVSTRALARGLRMSCLLEVNVSGEQSKSGVSVKDAPAAVDALMALEGIGLAGFMTMAPANDRQAARATFCGLRELAERMRTQTGLPLDCLSCGMSGDFEIAVEEGSTLVRLGRIVFDPAFCAPGESFGEVQGVGPAT